VEIAAGDITATQSLWNASDTVAYIEALVLFFRYLPKGVLKKVAELQANSKERKAWFDPCETGGMRWAFESQPSCRPPS
jgi:hypothetical protein